jgi:thymidine phosphorylase
VIDEPGRLPQARHVVEIQYEESETVWIKDVDARQIAQIVLETGAGRRNAEDSVDHSSGLSALVCVGDKLEPGNLIGRLHFSGSGQREDWERRLREAVVCSAEPVEPPRRILSKIM